MATKEEKNAFYKEIESIVASNTDINWIEAIIHYCQKTGMEIEVATTLVNDKLKKKLEEVAISKNYLKKSAKLNV